MPEEAAALAERVRREASEAVPASGKPKVLSLIGTADKPKYPGYNNLADDLIRRAGGQGIFTEIPEFSEVSLEEIIVRNPDVILINETLAAPGVATIAEQVLAQGAADASVCQLDDVFLGA